MNVQKSKYINLAFQITSSCAILSLDFHCVLKGSSPVSIQSQCHRTITLADIVLGWVKDHLNRVIVQDVNSGRVVCSLGDALGGGCCWDGQNCREVLSGFSNCILSDGDAHTGCCRSSREGGCVRPTSVVLSSCSNKSENLTL